MKLHFEPDLDYQRDAIAAVCNLFRGQEVCRTEFTVTKTWRGQQFDWTEGSLGVGNRLTVLDDQLLDNLRDIQLRQQLPPSESLSSGDFTVEMETGTGKTYVYLRTIFELNRQYGFTKFVIVVPTVAIKEGVYKSLQITEEHFRALYAGVPFDYFLYDSSKLGQVRNFATSSTIQVMVVTVGAINKKDVNNLYKESEKTGDELPIDLIRATRPVLIVDEPQTVDGGLQGQGKKALQEMHPLCTLRYSATHVDKHHMVYRLDAVDAYEKKLVKQIEVAAATLEDAHNKPYVRLVRVEAKAGSVSALVEVDVQGAMGIRRQEMRVNDGDKLEQTTKRAVYADCRIGEISAEKGKEFMELRVPGDELSLKPGQAWGDVDALPVQREMIRRTIREHLDKELRLRPMGIKVLSLFFIDEVANYRRYDKAGNPEKGPFAVIFEEEYRRAAKLERYNTLFGEVDLRRTAEEVHNGYFSIDKKGGWSEPELDKEGDFKNQGGRDDAERAYNLIMKEKELLLSLETPLKFIFSHSALREGWDNPNVFQICTLREIRTERERRQTIGRGLRLCVNQEGQRVRGDINTLTVIANESYENFAKNLQTEIERDTGLKFGVIAKDQFAALAVVGANGKPSALGTKKSQELWDHCRTKQWINAKGEIQDSLRVALRDDTLELPPEFAELKTAIQAVMKKSAGGVKVENADEKRRIRPNRVHLDSAEFRALWDRIKYKTSYRVEFDNAKLIADCTAALRSGPEIAKTRLQWRKANIGIGRSGVDATQQDSGAQLVVLNEGDIELPDLLTELERRTQLTRGSLGQILLDSGRLGDFERNPQAFIEVAARVITVTKQLALVEGIRYQRLGDSEFYRQELFDENELKGYLRNLVDAKSSVYEQVVFDSDVERKFVQELERHEEVKVYAKLPGWFTVPTPLGPYNPDWAVLVQTDEGERLYFVAETKGSAFLEDLRNTECGKIHCGEVHFAALHDAPDSARYERVRDVAELMQRV